VKRNTTSTAISTMAKQDMSPIGVALRSMPGSRLPGAGFGPAAVCVPRGFARCLSIGQLVGGVPTIRRGRQWPPRRQRWRREPLRLDRLFITAPRSKSNN
jgi:hypothetical protein